jgi:hypothetical protein
VSNYFSLDRIEGSVAVLYDDDENRVEAGMDKFIGRVFEGGCYNKSDDGMFVYDEEYTENKRRLVRELERQVFPE